MKRASAETRLMWCVARLGGWCKGGVIVTALRGGVVDILSQSHTEIVEESGGDIFDFELHRTTKGKHHTTRKMHSFLGMDITGIY